MFLYSLLRSGFDFMTIIMLLLALAIAVIFSMTLHEFSHALVANWCGDKTAKYAGRMTLNPLKHIDPMGFLMLIIVGFGWARPVPIDSTNFKNRKKGMILTCIAGVISNLLCAGVFLLLLYILYPVLSQNYIPNSGAGSVLILFCIYLLQFFVQINMMLALFNLLPIYPLDGFRLLNEFLPSGNRYSMFMYRYGSFVLLGLLLFSTACDMFGWWFLDIFGMFGRLISLLLGAVT